MTKALIVVDIQNDFCPGGSLVVKDGAKIVPEINKLMEDDYGLIIGTQDFHPAGHTSFASTHGKNPFETIKVKYGNQVLWPEHCIQGTNGVNFHDQLNVNKFDWILRKGRNLMVDSYSAFMENDKKTKTGLTGLLSYYDRDGENYCSFDEVHIVGIATDVCVFNTAMDCIYEFVGSPKVIVKLDCCAGVTDEGVAKAVEIMKDNGIKVK